MALRGNRSCRLGALPLGSVRSVVNGNPSTFSERKSYFCIFFETAASLISGACGNAAFRLEIDFQLRRRFTDDVEMECITMRALQWDYEVRQSLVW